MTFDPTQEQLDVVAGAAAGKSMLVSAGAGAAKTTTLKLLAPIFGGKRVLAVAFNKRIAEDLQRALPENVTVKTLNGLGHQAWGKQRGGRLEVDRTKLNRITTQVMKESGIVDENGDCWGAVRDFTRMLRQKGYVPEMQVRPVEKNFIEIEEVLEEFALTNEWPEEVMGGDDLCSLAETVLRRSIMEGFQKVIDYDDQIYLSTTFFCPYPHFDVVLVDEAQDLSPANHLQLIKCRPLQLIAVGDPRQAIYAFRGADYNSMVNLERKVGEVLGLPMGTFPLNISFRCPKAVVRRQLAHYPDFRAFDTNPEGEVKTLEQWEVKDVPEKSAILCRNNAPLVAMAFMLVRQGRGFEYYGVDMAKNLKGLIKKVAGFTGRTLRKAEEDMPSKKVLESLDLWYMAERMRLENAKKHELIGGLTDRKECCRIILKQAPTLGKAMKACDDMFNGMTGTLVLSTGHRAKGFEWEHVFHLDPWRIPSKWAREQMHDGYNAPMIQEFNLRYVIETRTKRTLTMISLNQCKDALPVEVESDE